MEAVIKSLHPELDSLSSCQQNTEHRSRETAPPDSYTDRLFIEIVDKQSFSQRIRRTSIPCVSQEPYTAIDKFR